MDSKKTKTLKDFTPQIQAKIPEYKKRYLSGIEDGGKFNSFKKENAEKLIYWNYTKCGFKKPVILVAENIYEAQLLFNYLVYNKNYFIPLIYFNYCLLNDIKLKEQLDSQLLSQLDSQLNSQLNSQLGSQLDLQLGSQLDLQLDSQLRSQLNSQLLSQLDLQLGSQLRSQLNSQLMKYNYNYLFTSNVYSCVLLAWWKFIKDEFKLDAKIGIELDSWDELYMQSGVYSAIFSELICIVSKYPKRIYRDNNGRLHNVNGNAVEWNCFSEQTKFDCYYVHGRNIPSWIINEPEKITKEKFIQELNADYRGAMYEVLGNEKMMKLLGVKEVCKKKNKCKKPIESDLVVDKKGNIISGGVKFEESEEEYILYESDFKDQELGILKFVSVECPSTRTKYLLGVPPETTDPLEAVANTFSITGKEYILNQTT